ncbi:MAG: 4Fe-4S ferredoxin, partial [Vicinamibacterales bacterium]
AYAPLFWGLAVAGGGLLPLALVLAAPTVAAAVTAAALLALAGGFAWEYIWVEAGQSVPLS